MITEVRPGYVVRRVSEAPTVECPCGQSTRIITSRDTPTCGLHVTFIQDSIRHCHRRTTEMYYILEGSGKMELNDETYDIEPGMVIQIDPGTWHRVYDTAGIRTIVVSVPAFDPADEFFE
jgi:mannose-6-phosphate isomerase-like protein (cupin superfamily)